MNATELNESPGAVVGRPRQDYPSGISKSGSGQADKSVRDSNLWYSGSNCCGSANCGGHSRYTWRQIIPLICGAATVCVGIIGLSGNLFHLPILQSILLERPTMKLATSVGLILCGCSLLVSAIYTLKTEFRLLMQTFFSVSAAIVTVGILLKYLSIYYGSLHDPNPIDFDELDNFLPSFGSLAAFSIYITAIIYRIIGTILEWKCTASVVSGALVAMIGLVSLIGYFTNTPILFWNSGNVSTGMAIHTALAFFLLGTGLMVRPNKPQLICK